MIFQGCPGETQVEVIHAGEGDDPVRGSSKQLPNTRLLTCKWLKAETRIVNRHLQTPGLEKTGKPDCQLVTERIARTWTCQFATYSSQPGGPLKGAAFF